MTICIVTYDRPDELRRTIKALVTHLKYDARLRWHLADDGSPAGYLDAMLKDFPELDPTWTVTKRKGWGANVNKAMRTIKTPYIFLIEDDYVATYPVDLTSGVRLIEALPAAGLIRYDGIIGHSLDLEMDEVKADGQTIHYLLVRPESYHLNVYSNRPHLVHRRFHEVLGPYIEGRSLGDTESEYAHRFKDFWQQGKPVHHICCLPDYVLNRFDHIGHSRQGTAQDVTAKEKTRQRG